MDSIVKNATDTKNDWIKAFSRNLVDIFVTTYKNNPDLMEKLGHLLSFWRNVFPDSLLNTIERNISYNETEVVRNYSNSSSQFISKNYYTHSNISNRGRYNEENHKFRSKFSSYHSRSPHKHSYHNSHHHSSHYNDSRSPSSRSRSPPYDPNLNIPSQHSPSPSEAQLLNNIISNYLQTSLSSNIPLNLNMNVDPVGSIGVSNSLSPSLFSDLAYYTQNVQFSSFVTPRTGKTTSALQSPSLNLSHCPSGLHEMLYILPKLCSDCGVRYIVIIIFFVCVEDCW
jgi:hypothetical protein